MRSIVALRLDQSGDVLRAAGRWLTGYASVSWPLVEFSQHRRAVDPGLSVPGAVGIVIRRSIALSAQVDATCFRDLSTRPNPVARAAAVLSESIGIPSHLSLPPVEIGR